MRNRTFTITVDQLNNSGTIKIDSSMTLYQTTIAKGLVSGVIFPKELQSINATGCDLEYNFFANENEYSEYTADDTNYDFIYLPNNSTLEDNNVLNRCKYFLVKKENDTDTATSDLRIDFINYAGYEIRWV